MKKLTLEKDHWYKMKGNDDTYFLIDEIYPKYFPEPNHLIIFQTYSWQEAEEFWITSEEEKEYTNDFIGMIEKDVTSERRVVTGIILSYENWLNEICDSKPDNHDVCIDCEIKNHKENHGHDFEPQFDAPNNFN
jgi:hypothetical protein